MKLIERPTYLERIKALRGKPDIKVITGVRRCGKSELLKAFISYLRKIDPEGNVLYVDLMEYAAQQDTFDAEMVADGTSFAKTQSHTEVLRHRDMGGVTYDLLGKLVEATNLTRRTVAAILQKIKPGTFAMYQQNPEEFIRKTGHLINEEKAAMIVEKITYYKLEQRYDSTIFTAEQRSADFDKAFKSYNHKHDINVKLCYGDDTKISGSTSDYFLAQVRYYYSDGDKGISQTMELHINMDAYAALSSTDTHACRLGVLFPARAAGTGYPAV